MIAPFAPFLGPPTLLKCSQTKHPAWRWEDERIVHHQSLSPPTRSSQQPVTMPPCQFAELVGPPPRTKNLSLASPLFAWEEGCAGSCDGFFCATSRASGGGGSPSCDVTRCLAMAVLEQSCALTTLVASAPFEIPHLSCKPWKKSRHCLYLLRHHLCLCNLLWLRLGAPATFASAPRPFGLDVPFWGFCQLLWLLCGVERHPLHPSAWSTTDTATSARFLNPPATPEQVASEGKRPA